MKSLDAALIFALSAAALAFTCVFNVNLVGEYPAPGAFIVLCLSWVGYLAAAALATRPKLAPAWREVSLLVALALTAGSAALTARNYVGLNQDDDARVERAF